MSEDDAKILELLRQKVAEGELPAEAGAALIDLEARLRQAVEPATEIQ